MKLRQDPYYPERLEFRCPCGMEHSIPVRGPNAWGWNGSMESPTFTPSIRVQGGRQDGSKPRVCHSFVMDGKIAFCADSTHPLAGQTVELQEWPL